jgi:hypothetical protein
MDALNTLQISFLVRTLFVLAAIGFMVIAGALAQRQASRPGRPALGIARSRPAVVEAGRRLESNDPDASAPDAERRAA